MAIIPQDYPRDEKGFLDVSRIAPHTSKIAFDDLKVIIQQAILRANKKSSRAILHIEPDALADDKQKMYRLKGKKLFEYFKRYYGDPATTAYDCLGRHYTSIAREQFRNQTLQKERMNSG